MIKSVRVKSFLAVTVLVIASASSAYAVVPSTTEPGIILRSLEEDDRLERHEPIISIPKTDETEAGTSAEKIFILNDIILDGVSVYKKSDFEKTFEDFLGQKISLADLNQIAHRMTLQYRADGYILSRVIVPPQKISDGIVHLQAIEGRIDKIEIVGGVTDKGSVIAKMADKIRRDGPANTKTIERYLLLIDDLPGITARSLVRPSKAPGAGGLVISIEQDKFEGSAGIDNRGSKPLGPYRATLTGVANSLSGYHDRTTIRGLIASQTDELRFADIVHEEQIGSEGMRLNGRFAITDTKPGGRISDLDIQGDSNLSEVWGFYPVLRGRQMNFSLIGGLSVLNSKADFLGFPITEDRLRYLRVGGHFDFVDGGGVSQFDLEVVKGVKIFNATSDGIGRSRANGAHDFLRANITATRIQDLGGRLSLMGSVSGQATPDSLLASEEFAVGGGDLGRAYDAGEIAGDKGIAGVIELRYGGSAPGTPLKSYQAYGFYDVGKVYKKAPLVGESAKDSVASAGVGLRFNLEADISGYIEIAAPLTRKVSSENGRVPRLFFSFSKRF
jgi:hemolysin activation/secretion protein